MANTGLGLFSLLLIVASRTCYGISDKCSSDKPGWASHRTLSIPGKKWGGLNDDAMVNALCCVYTHVEPSSGDIARLVTYDGSTLEIAGDSFLDIAETAMAKICSMSMGADDCERQKSCVVASQSRKLNIQNLSIDGGQSGWNTEKWRVTVDGVMGGRSTGNVKFQNNDPTMTFSGDISLVGGGFASVRRSLSPSIDLRSFAGIVVELMATDSHGQEGNNQPPLGVHLQLHDSKSRWGFAAAFAIPLASSNGVTSRVFIPIEAFDRGSSSGFQCRSCSLDLSSINGMDFYVLFQDGSFELQIKSITAVEKEQYFDSPQISFASNNAAKDLLESTIYSANYLFNKGYIELCIAVYSATLNSLIKASGGVSETMKGVACDGLRLSNFQTTKAEIARKLRYTADALLADLAGASRNEVVGWFLPYPPFYDEGKYLCMDMGFTSAATSYVPNDPPNQDKFDGPFQEGRQILEISSSNELGRAWMENVEECASYCLINNRCLSFYFSRQVNFGGECRLSSDSRITVGAETFSPEATFLYDYYERNNKISMDKPAETSLEDPFGSSNDDSGSSDLVFSSKIKVIIMSIMCYAAILYL